MKKLAKILFEKNLTIACAESCTGGFLSHLLTNIPGSSRYFKGSIICYSNQIKNEFLKVPKKILKEKGAVSLEVAKITAQNIKKLFKTHIGISTTGVAGPSALENKPVGTIFIGIAFKNRTKVIHLKLKGDRIKIKEKASKKALEFLYNLIK